MRDVFGNILKKVQKSISGYSMKEVAEEAARLIKVRTRLGYGVQSRGEPREKLKDFASTITTVKTTKSGKKRTSRKGSYINFRKKFKKLSSETRPNKSNLTLTGQLLNSLIGRFNKNKAIVQVQNNRNDGVKNSDIVKWQVEQGRPFLEVTDKELKALQTMIKKDLIKALRKNRR